MLASFSLFITMFFIIACGMAIHRFYRAAHNSYFVLLIILVWTSIQGILSYFDFYLITTSIPPRLIFIVAPPIALIIYLFNSIKGKSFIDSLDAEILTSIHGVRVIVEIVLVALCSRKLIPVSMTMDGQNFDILSGITATFIGYFSYQKLNKPFLIIWNIVCLALVLNVVITGILSAPSVFQKLAFDQPNIGVLYFPFVWLPSVIVPLVIFAHLVCLRRLFLGR